VELDTVSRTQFAQDRLVWRGPESSKMRARQRVGVRLCECARVCVTAVCVCARAVSTGTVLEIPQGSRAVGVW
jgi:hypothetical protein